MRFLPSRRTKPSAPTEPDRHVLLTEYVLHMSISCLGDQDVTPLYEEYMRDTRLGDTEKGELTEVYHTLLPRTPLGASA